jgi:hypothetical protein
LCSSGVEDQAEEPPCLVARMVIGERSAKTNSGRPG